MSDILFFFPRQFVLIIFQFFVNTLSLGLFSLPSLASDELPDPHSQYRRCMFCALVTTTVSLILFLLSATFREIEFILKATSYCRTKLCSEANRTVK